MKTGIALSFSLLAASCAQQECDTCGRWRSDADRTLAEMHQSDKLTDAQRKLFGNDFFGKLVVETTPDATRAYFPDENPQSVAWADWEVVSRSGDAIVIRYKPDDEWITRSLSIHGSCYRIEQPELGFGEWFCRE